MCEYTNISPYNEDIVSDHIALVVDIDTKKLQKGDLIIGKEKKFC